MLKTRTAIDGDCRLLWQWVNDPDVDVVEAHS